MKRFFLCVFMTMGLMLNTHCGGAEATVITGATFIMGATVGTIFTLYGVGVTTEEKCAEAISFHESASMQLAILRNRGATEDSDAVVRALASVNTALGVRRTLCK